MSLTGNERAELLASKFTAEAGLLHILEETNARPKDVPPALLALQTAKERSAAAAASMQQGGNLVKTMVGTWNGLAVPPAPVAGDGSTSSLEEIALPMVQSEVRALPEMIFVNPEEQERIANRLDAFKEKLRIRHVAAKDEFIQLRKTITKELELEVSILGKSLKDKISRSESEIEHIVAGLSDDKLVNMQLDEIDQQWHRIELEFDQRAAWIQQLSAQCHSVEHLRQLNHIESRRSHLIGTELQRLVTRLTEIGFALPADIERLLHSESTEANGHVLRNRASYAELIARLKVVAVQRVNDLEKIFAERKANWRKLRHERALARYFEQIHDKDYVKPPQRRKVFEEVKKIQKVSHSQCMMKLRGLGETAPPQLNAELCKRLSQHISDLLASVSEVADRAVAFLKRHEQELHDQGMGYVAVMRAQMVEAAYVSEGEIEEIIEKQCMPEITKVTSGVSSIRDRFDVALQAEEKRIYQPALAIIEFFRQSAVVYNTFLAEIQKVDEDITEAINLRADRYEDDKNRLEMQLADLLRQLRSAKDLEALEERMNEVHALVGENGTIEQTHRDFNRDSVALAASHVPDLHKKLDDFQIKFAERFSLYPQAAALRDRERKRQEDELKAAEQAVNADPATPATASASSSQSILDEELAERVESSVGTVYLVKREIPLLAHTLMTTLSEEEQKEADARAAAEAELKAIEEKTKAESAPVAAAAAPAAAAQAPPSARGSKKDAPLPSKDPKTAGKVDPKASPPPSEPEPAPPTEPLEPEVKAPPFNDIFLPHEGDAEKYGIIDTDGLPCLAVLYFDLTVAEDAARNLRQAFLERWDDVGSYNLHKADVQNQGRQVEFAKDINQVLRAHRPRIRRIDSDVFEIRAVELSQNRAKFERHAQRVQATAYANNAAFHAEVQAIEQTLDTYVAELQAWQHQLHEAAAAVVHVTIVQALQKKVKARHADISAQIRERFAALQKLCADQKSKSQTSETQFVESCRLLAEEVLASTRQYCNIKVLSHSRPGTSNISRAPSSLSNNNGTSSANSRAGSRPQSRAAGNMESTDASAAVSTEDEGLGQTSNSTAGTFNADEVKFYHALAAELSKQVDQVLEERSQQIAALQGKSDATLDLRTFDSDFHSALEDLSVAQSLGHKYGAPKMKVTIRLREEFAASEAAQTALDEAWSLLQKLCRPGSALANTLRPGSAMSTRSENFDGTLSASQTPRVSVSAGSANGTASRGTSAAGAKRPGVSFAGSSSSSSSSSALENDQPLDDAELERQSLTSRIISVLDQLRVGLYRRAVYLSCLQRTLYSPPLPQIPTFPPALLDNSQNQDDALVENSALVSKQLQLLQTIVQDPSYSIYSISSSNSASATPAAAASTKKDDKKAAPAAAAPAAAAASSPIAAAALELYPSKYHLLQNAQAQVLGLTQFFHTIVDATATGRIEMSALYKEYWTKHGDRLRSLGRVQTERPSLFDERMVSEEARSKQVHLDALTAFRQMVEILGENIHIVPKVCFNDILFRTQSAAARESARLRDLFNAQNNTSQTARKDHQRLLKPSLGSPDARSALDSLCTREAERSKRIRMEIVVYRQKWLQSLNAQCERFLRRIFHAANTLMAAFDTIPALCDLDTPQLESVAKRRGLKRAMRQQTRLTRSDSSNQPVPPADASAPSAEGERFLTKTWPGVSLSGFQFPPLPILSAQEADAKASSAKADEEKAKAEAAAAANPKDAKKGGAAKAAPASAAASATTSDVSVESAVAEIMCQPLTGYKILVNREVVAQRNQAIAAFQAYFQAEVQAAIENTQNADLEEEKWTQNWLRMVQLLKE